MILFLLFLQDNFKSMKENDSLYIFFTPHFLAFIMCLKFNSTSQKKRMTYLYVVY